jgi:hypothetical protein
MKPTAQHRIDADTLKVITTQVKAGLNTVPKTDLEAAFACGVQRVLDVLRDGYTVGT